MPGTLRAPAPGAKPAQAFSFDYSTAVEDMKQLEALEEEEALLATLQGTPANATVMPKGAYDSEDFWDTRSKLA